MDREEKSCNTYEKKIPDICSCDANSLEMQLLGGDFPEYKTYLEDVRNSKQQRIAYVHELGHPDPDKFGVQLEQLQEFDCEDTVHKRARNGLGVVDSIFQKKTLEECQETQQQKGVDAEMVRFALHSAASNTNREVYQYLQQNGADYNAVNQNRETPIVCALKCQNQAMVLDLQQKKDLDVRSADSSGMTSLMQACQFSPSMVKTQLCKLLSQQ